ncbi:hypothetical protein QNI16_00860 [Cytophagaceae bacterium YF14B1]|uniref:Uncharacterized protein n=1 Tax=Xanthocytophaga flava TaxID=3048013 RepID=A0AAE3U3R9_9BACT|nr:hypothetical protein [Xanthocytophaga flavus]MDJ1479009.1 hypothetical protein [Xanthocytophaga flavus]
MANKLYFFLIYMGMIMYSCTDNTSTKHTTTAEPKPDFATIQLPQTWKQVPDTGMVADSALVSHFHLQPDTAGSDPEWKIIGKIANPKWYGLLYTYHDIDASELRLATYSLSDSLLSDIALIQDKVVGILTMGTFSAIIDQKYAISINERVKSMASETDSTIISDEQTEKKFQVVDNGLIKLITNTSANNVTEAATHPEEEQEGAFYEEYHYESTGTSDVFIYTVMGQEKEKHYYFENKEGAQRNLDFIGATKNKPDNYEFKLDGKKVSAQFEEYTQDGELSIPQRIVFAYASGEKQIFTLTQ